jgi:hypothetical protein
LRRVCALIGWVIAATVLTAAFGGMTAPLLLILAADVAVGVLAVRAAAPPPLAASGRPL